MPPATLITAQNQPGRPLPMRTSRQDTRFNTVTRTCLIQVDHNGGLVHHTGGVYAPIPVRTWLKRCFGAVLSLYNAMVDNCHINWEHYKPYSFPQLCTSFNTLTSEAMIQDRWHHGQLYLGATARRAVALEVVNNLMSCYRWGFPHTLHHRKKRSFTIGGKASPFKKKLTQMVVPRFYVDYQGQKKWWVVLDTGSAYAGDHNSAPVGTRLLRLKGRGKCPPLLRQRRDFNTFQHSSPAGREYRVSYNISIILYVHPVFMF